MIETADNPRDKAIVALLFDSGVRVGELMTLRVKDVNLETDPGHIIVNGKTGMRKIPIRFSAPYIAYYLTYMKGKAPGSPLWLNVGQNSDKNASPDYWAFRAMLKRLGVQAKIKKRIYPHLFRHSRASYYANKLTEQQLKMFFGWTGGSDMAATYVHLSGRDIDNAVLRADGAKRAQEEVKPKLTVKICERCRLTNTTDSTYCRGCAAPLDIKTAMEAQEQAKSVKEAVQEAFKDPKMMEDIVHAYLMMQREKGKK